MKLYEIPTEFERLRDALEAMEAGEEPDGDAETPETILKQLMELQTSLADKSDAIAALIRERAATEKAYREEAALFAGKAKAAAAGADRLKDYLLSTLEKLGLDKVAGARFAVAVQTNSRPAILWTRDPLELPEEFRRVVVSLDGAAAYDALRAAGELPDGFTVETGRHLRIR